MLYTIHNSKLDTINHWYWVQCKNHALQFSVHHNSHSQFIVYHTPQNTMHHIRHNNSSLYTYHNHITHHSIPYTTLHFTVHSTFTVTWYITLYIIHNSTLYIVHSIPHHNTLYTTPYTYTPNTTSQYTMDHTVHSKYHILQSVHCASQLQSVN